MSIEQGDSIGWICPVCKNMCHSYDVLCPFCVIEIENREHEFFKMLKMFEEKNKRRGNQMTTKKFNIEHNKKYYCKNCVNFDRCEYKDKFHVTQCSRFKEPMLVYVVTQTLEYQDFETHYETKVLEAFRTKESAQAFIDSKPEIGDSHIELFVKDFCGEVYYDIREMEVK